LTDGVVVNNKDISNLLKAYCANTRVFAYGIGNAGSKDLVRAMARVANGQWEMIIDGENLENKLSPHIKLSQHPALIDVIFSMFFLFLTEKS
jgi:hypothetical protein